MLTRLIWKGSNDDEGSARVKAVTRWVVSGFCTLILVSWDLSFSIPLWQGYTFNLNCNLFWQLLYGHTAPRWLVLDPLLVFDIHLSKIFHVGEKYLSLDNFVQRRTGLGENGRKRFQNRSGLFTSGPMHDVSLGISWQLARTIDCMRCLDGLPWCWSVLTHNKLKLYTRVWSDSCKPSVSNRIDVVLSIDAYVAWHLYSELGSCRTFCTPALEDGNVEMKTAMIASLCVTWRAALDAKYLQISINIYLQRARRGNSQSSPYLHLHSSCACTW